jgi:hypothetical protein
MSPAAIPAGCPSVKLLPPPSPVLVVASDRKITDDACDIPMRTVPTAIAAGEIINRITRTRKRELVEDILLIMLLPPKPPVLDELRSLAEPSEQESSLERMQAQPR